MKISAVWGFPQRALAPEEGFAAIAALPQQHRQNANCLRVKGHFRQKHATDLLGQIWLPRPVELDGSRDGLGHVICVTLAQWDAPWSMFLSPIMRKHVATTMERMLLAPIATNPTSPP
jgi:hypothetical protein